MGYPYYLIYIILLHIFYTEEFRLSHLDVEQTTETETST